MTPFSTTRHFPSKPADVFAAVKDGKRLARWWGPNGFSNRFEVFEFQPGGRWIFSMIGPDGTVYPNESVFSRIEADRLVVIRHICPPVFELTITLEPLDDGTRLEWVQAFSDPSVARAVAHIVAPANEENLDRLGAELGLDKHPG
ncbi:SRPBCC domain-containing protein [Zoogloea sp.]|uniref:SRPBCC domain-containing protein n=1 Tax=Zoogloea sp. TaxID=49181 RepID=UPI001AD245C5|nr:SRPBCC domain-containing protein [Zoogloea sp.]MBN8284704.1 SRPBCC domain-containing protein [Zoogloea sp.]